MACKGCRSRGTGLNKMKINKAAIPDNVTKKYTVAGTNELIIDKKYSIPKRMKVTAEMRRKFVGSRNYTIKSRVSTVDNRLIWHMLNNKQYAQWLDMPAMMALEAEVVKVKISPKAEALAIENDIDISTVEGSGKKGAITLTDIKRMI